MITDRGELGAPSPFGFTCPGDIVIRGLNETLDVETQNHPVEIIANFPAASSLGLVHDYVFLFVG